MEEQFEYVADKGDNRRNSLFTFPLHSVVEIAITYPVMDGYVTNSARQALCSPQSELGSSTKAILTRSSFQRGSWLLSLLGPGLCDIPLCGLQALGKVPLL